MQNETDLVGEEGESPSSNRESLAPDASDSLESFDRNDPIPNPEYWEKEKAVIVRHKEGGNALERYEQSYFVHIRHIKNY